MHARKILPAKLTTLVLLLSAAGLHASDADLKIPPLDSVTFDGLGGVSGYTLMYLGIVMCAIGAAFGLVQYLQTKSLPVHKSMADVSQHHLGDVQNLSVPAGQISGHPVAADRGLHLFLFQILRA